MDKDRINKAIQEIRNINLTKDEKNIIFERVMKTPVLSPYMPKVNVWNFFSIHKSFAYALASLLIFVIAGGTLTYAAEGTVPGDLLYPIKVNVTEPMRDALAITPVEKASWNAEKAVRRLNEAETLANKNKLTPKYRQQIEQNFSRNVNAFDNNMRFMATTTPTRNNINNFFNQSINKHAGILQKIGSNKTDGEQREVNLLEQTVLKAHQIQPFGMHATNTERQVFNTASSSQKVNIYRYNKR